jgi:predicted ATPase
MEKAEGNPLFAEEIVSYLTERGIVRTAVEFDASALAAALPLSIQSLLTGRVDRLAPNDRALMQAASVIGRRFNSQLLAAALGRISHARAAGRADVHVDVAITHRGPRDVRGMAAE